MAQLVESAQFPFYGVVDISPTGWTNLHRSRCGTAVMGGPEDHGDQFEAFIGLTERRRVGAESDDFNGSMHAVSAAARMYWPECPPAPGPRHPSACRKPKSHAPGKPIGCLRGRYRRCVVGDVARPPSSGKLLSGTTILIEMHCW